MARHLNIRKLRWGGTGLGLLLLAWPAGALRAGPAPDVWVTGSVRIALPDGWDCDLQSQQKRRDNGAQPYDYENDAYFTHGLEGPWSATLGLTEVENHSGKAWLLENRPVAALSWREEVDGWRVATRVQAEWRDREAHADGWRGRFRTIVAAPMPANNRWSPYASGEGFFDEVAGRWNQTRFFLGTGYAWSQNCSGDAYVGWKGDYAPATAWRQTPIIGLKVLFRL